MGSGVKLVRQIQQALKEKGFDPGEVDGIWGRKTIAAVKQFQLAHQLEVDGIVGPKTTEALFTDIPLVSSVFTQLIPWFEEARSLLGTKEILGHSNNPIILDWAEQLDIKYPADEVPWCGLFVAHCIGATLPQEILPRNPLGARQWETFGARTEPRFGAIMVFWRLSKDSGKGHIGFYVGEDDTAYQILGGNQSDKVCLTWVAKNRLTSARWPKTAASLTTTFVRIESKNQNLSINEV
ncbi:TIGR02594 family protein [Azorhizophilus paspali]|uniref:TIGR02594 family protein n=1 Tax=Azorhizophilus paspali TaxID=69963 RepID=A0ABV6SKV4_AZOPA